MRKAQNNSTDNVTGNERHNIHGHESLNRDTGNLLIQDRFQTTSIGGDCEEDEVDDSDEDVDDYNAKKIHRNLEGFQVAATSRSHETMQKGKSWAAIVNVSSRNSLESKPSSSLSHFTLTETVHFQEHEKEDDSLGGQFSDAENDDDVCVYPARNLENTNDDDSNSRYDISNIEMSDEECDAYILDPDESEARKILTSGQTYIYGSNVNDQEFPSLNSLVTGNLDSETGKKIWEIREIEEAKRRAESLKPISNDGKLYNSFRRYKNIISSTGIDEMRLHGYDETINLHSGEVDAFTIANHLEPASSFNYQQSEDKMIHSKIMGGNDMSGQGITVDDDGEGWITCVKDIHSRKIKMALDPAVTTSYFHPKSSTTANVDLPSRSRRAACATTDFAMQNVILQMNLELLTLDGVRIRKLKSWVFRCAACYTVYTGNDIARLFCGRCGSPSLQRVAASVDGRTGQFRLHLKKNYTYNLRGTQFNLPAPGKGNKFKGDLLLREDQLLYGAWSQKAKSTKTSRDSQCIFGADITSAIGCLTDYSKRDDIKVGFGGKNPNASKFGRERRGKKKKSVNDKACGLRRY